MAQNINVFCTIISYASLELSFVYRPALALAGHHRLSFLLFTDLP